MWRGLSLVLLLAVLIGCRAGTAPQELAQLRARVSTLEAENAHLQGQLSLAESERDQLREQLNTLGTELAKAQGAQAIAGAGTVAVSENLVVMPREVFPGEWLAVYVKNYPTRLLPQAGIALRGGDGVNIARVGQLAAANVFLLAVPKTVSPGPYQIVLGEAGTLGSGAKLDDTLSVTVKGR